MNKEKIFPAVILVFFILSLIAASFLIVNVPGKKFSNFHTDVKGFAQTRENIAVVNIYGPIQIQTSGFLGSLPSGADYTVQELKRLRNNPNIKAVVLRINSPGGSVGAVQEIYSELLKLKESGKKIVASQAEVSASGGYYLAVASDKIVSNPGAITGSIGVIISITNVEKLFEKIGVGVEVIKSKELKDIGSSMRAMTDEEREILKDMVDSAYQQFLTAVKKGRGAVMTEEKIEEVSDGRIMTGAQAKEIGLVDELGNLEDAINIAAELAGIKKDDIKVFEERRDWKKMLMQQLGTKASNPFSSFLPPQTGLFEYLWVPEY
ncbi:signal peptide peptidase SppA [bacterium]|nr:signal peptide peptidase SppA [bacterium]